MLSASHTASLPRLKRVPLRDASRARTRRTTTFADLRRPTSSAADTSADRCTY